MDKDTKINNGIEGAADTCSGCSRPLCIRQQVINLALGYIESMSCLFCLAKETNNEPEQIIENLAPYIDGRECFRKSWIRYESVQHCPDPLGCLPDACFKTALKGNTK